MDKPEKCRWCDKATFARGLCSRHYQRARRLAKQGKPCSHDMEPMARAKGRPAKDTGKGIAWLAKLYDDLSRDVAAAIYQIEQGNYEHAKEILSNKKSNERSIQ